MKHLKILLFLPLGLLFLGAGEENMETVYVPILLERSVLEKSISIKEARELEKPGKIYVFGDYLYINERYKGVHVINNSDPTNPVNESFIKIPGCIDIAIKGTVLYADHAVDLVAIDISKKGEVKVTKREKEVFPEHYPPGYDYLPYKFEQGQRPDSTIIIEWVVK